jgi:ADP-ribose pyrophosphatase YjhB (NUDIX family)
MFEHADPGIEPHPENLAARADVLARQKTHAVDSDAFAAARNRIASGLTWGVGAITTDDEGRTLLVREDGEWLVPGGEVEDSETHHEALRRELREETGIEVTVEDLVAVTEVAFVHDGRTVAFYFAHYTATSETTSITANPGLPDEEIEAVRWAHGIPDETVDREVVSEFR